MAATEQQKAAQLKYKSTPKGSVMYARYYTKLKANGYYSQYMKHRRIAAKIAGLCQQCFLIKAEKGMSVCLTCNEKAKARNKLWRMKNLSKKAESTASSDTKTGSL